MRQNPQPLEYARPATEDIAFTMDHNPCNPDQPQPSSQEGNTPQSLPLIIRKFAEFYLEPEEIPFTKALPMGVYKKEPDYCVSHLSEPVEPEHSHWVEASHLLDMVTPVDVEDDPWWEPTAAYRKLERLVDAMGKVAFRKIPNPDYREEECRRWREENIPTKFTWGVGSLVDVEK